MKRTPLRRKTPLRVTRGPQSGSKARPRGRAPADRTDPRERAHVLQRDGECIARKLERMGWTVPGHVCTDGFSVLPVEQTPEMLTVEHVKPTARMGVRANSSGTAEAERGDPQRRWMVAACWNANVNGWTSANRSYVRVYLELLERRGRL